IKKRHSFFSFLAALLIVGSINLWVGTSHEMVVQADSIDQPTPINQIFPDSALAEVMRYQLGKSSVTD
ncbi:internalin N-terminal domain-containing protein, partial [Listeria seeligeri]